MSQAGETPKRAQRLVILVAALGYFVDIYDLLLFSIVRKKSLIELGVTSSRKLKTLPAPRRRSA